MQKNEYFILLKVLKNILIVYTKKYSTYHVVRQSYLKILTQSLSAVTGDEAGT